VCLGPSRIPEYTHTFLSLERLSEFASLKQRVTKSKVCLEAKVVPVRVRVRVVGAIYNLSRSALSTAGIGGTAPTDKHSSRCF
jgi:hypothetical protein